MTRPVLLHIPHSSVEIPAEYLSDYLVTEQELWAEKLSLTDMYTDQLYQLAGAERAVFPVSRFLVDAERFDDDSQELMAGRGMGVLYTTTTDLKPLRRQPDAVRRRELLDRYYYPHHNGLNDWADRALQEYGYGLLVDCHSYPSKVLPYEMEGDPRPRPQIGVGTDAFHTPPELERMVVSAFADKGYEVGLNSPFAGTLTPGRYYHNSHHIHAFMIEVRKDLYMNEKTGDKLPAFDRIRTDLSSILQGAADLVAGLYRSA